MLQKLLLRAKTHQNWLEEYSLVASATKL
uniref:Uncharacterized protein n=1 Tax=Arundo donax TaxID=35708 RepID=A0A0A9EZV6_ARUDO